MSDIYDNTQTTSFFSEEKMIADIKRLQHDVKVQRRKSFQKMRMAGTSLEVDDVLLRLLKP